VAIGYGFVGGSRIRAKTTAMAAATAGSRNRNSRNRSSSTAKKTTTKNAALWRQWVCNRKTQKNNPNYRSRQKRDVMSRI